MKPRGLLPTSGAAAALIAVFIGAAVAQQPPPKGATAEIPELPAIEDLEATIERPLFMRTRRPPKAPAPAAAVADAEKVTVPSEESPADLTGIVSGPDRIYAILTNRSTKEILYLRKGEMIEDWSIQEIGPRHVVLGRGPGSMRLELFEEKEPGKTAAKDGEERMARPPPNRPRFQSQSQRQRPRPNRQPNRRPRNE